MPPTPPPRFGKYSVQGVVGHGGFGLVYEAWDPVLERRVAIKTCTHQDAAVRGRFLREARIAGGLRHPNIVTVYDLGQDQDVPYLVQEFLGGEDLSAIIDRRDALAMEHRVEILLQAARGLDYAHRAGVVHRDVKPGNLRVVDDGSVKILDFGIARLAAGGTAHTLAGATLGTEGYMAPEQIRGRNVDSRADIFSFGVVAYELLGGELPFQGENPAALFYQIMEEPPPSVTALAPDCPSRLARLVETCLSRDPDLRPQTMALVAAHLEAVLAELPRGGDETPTAQHPIAGRSGFAELPDDLRMLESRVGELLSAGDTEEAELEIELGAQQFASRPEYRAALAELSARIGDTRRRMADESRLDRRHARLCERAERALSESDGPTARLSAAAALRAQPGSPRAAALLVRIEEFERRSAQESILGQARTALAAGEPAVALALAEPLADGQCSTEATALAAAGREALSMLAAEGRRKRAQVGLERARDELRSGSVWAALAALGEVEAEFAELPGVADLSTELQGALSKRARWRNEIDLARDLSSGIFASPPDAARRLVALLANDPHDTVVSDLRLEAKDLARRVEEGRIADEGRRAVLDEVRLALDGGAVQSALEIVARSGEAPFEGDDGAGLLQRLRRASDLVASVQAALASAGGELRSGSGTAARVALERARQALASAGPLVGDWAALEQQRRTLTDQLERRAEFARRRLQEAGAHLDRAALAEAQEALDEAMQAGLEDSGMIEFAERLRAAHEQERAATAERANARALLAVGDIEAAALAAARAVALWPAEESAALAQEIARSRTARVPGKAIPETPEAAPDPTIEESGSEALSAPPVVVVAPGRGVRIPAPRPMARREPTGPPKVAAPPPLAPVVAPPAPDAGSAPQSAPPAPWPAAPVAPPAARWPARAALGGVLFAAGAAAWLSTSAPDHAPTSSPPSTAPLERPADPPRTSAPPTGAGRATPRLPQAAGPAPAARGSAVSASASPSPRRTLAAAADPLPILPPQPARSSPHGTGDGPRPATEPVSSPALPPSPAPANPAAVSSQATPAPLSTPGRLQLAVEPYAEVFIGEQYVGVTPLAPLELAPGEYSVRLQHPDYRSLLRRVRIRASQTSKLSIDLALDGIRIP